MVQNYTIPKGNYLQIKETITHPVLKISDSTNIGKVISYFDKEFKKINKQKAQTNYVINEEYISKKHPVHILIVGNYDMCTKINQLPIKQSIKINPLFGKKRYLEIKDCDENESPYYNLFPEKSTVFKKIQSSNLREKEITATIITPIYKEHIDEKAKIVKFYKQFNEWAQSLYAIR